MERGTKNACSRVPQELGLIFGGEPRLPPDSEALLMLTRTTCRLEYESAVLVPSSNHFPQEALHSIHERRLLCSSWGSSP